MTSMHSYPMMMVCIYRTLELHHNIILQTVSRLFSICINVCTLTICDNVDHPEPQNNRFAHCTKVLYVHWHCASTVLGESTDGYRGDGVLDRCRIYIIHACRGSIDKVLNFWSPCILWWLPRYFQDVLRKYKDQWAYIMYNM